MSQYPIHAVLGQDETRRLLSFWLNVKWGYKLRLFSSQEECLDALDESPALMILDITLPGVACTAFLEEATSRAPDIPVITLAENADGDAAIDSLRNGAFDALPKAFDAPRLRNTVVNALDAYSMKREIRCLRQRLIALGCLENDDEVIPMNRVKEMAVRNALNATRGNILEAAKRLKISRSTFYELMKKYTIGSD